MENRNILLCSGGLGETALRHIHSTRTLAFVFTDKGSQSVVDYCEKNSIPFFAGNPRQGGAKTIIKNLDCSVLLSVNYLFVVENDLLSAARDYAINFHGSLLPKYRGRTPHVWAIINGEKETGVTAHLMTHNVDEGDIVRQVRVDIDDNDTGASVLNKFQQIYPILLDEVLTAVEQRKITPVPQDHSLATFFGKRTPGDGEISWDWQKERIRNWVRAQSAPYPGAFTHYEGEKVTIQAIAYSDFGFRFDMPNGLILQIRPQIIVKTPNGAVTLTNITTPVTLNFQVGKLFSCLT